MSRKKIVADVIDSGVVAVVRTEDEKKLMNIISALYKGGIRAIEITLTVPNAIEMIKTAANELPDELLLGVGSVLNAEDAQKSIDAGAKYVVSPVLKKEVITVTHDNDLPVFPGAFSPTEIQTAYEMGADIVKVFPADTVGMKYFKSIKAPMPHLKLMPTGGVSLTNVGDWLAHGACAVGIGSALLDKEAIAGGNYDKLTENAKKIIENLNNYKNNIK